MATEMRLAGSCHTPTIGWGTSRSWLLLTKTANLLAVEGNKAARPS